MKIVKCQHCGTDVERKYARGNATCFDCKSERNRKATKILNRKKALKKLDGIVRDM